MKSRRRIAFTKAGLRRNRARLQQGIATGEMGFSAQFAWQQTRAAHVRFGSKADIARTRLVARCWRRCRSALCSAISLRCVIRHQTECAFEIGHVGGDTVGRDAEFF
jgi:hypothetical protein